MYNIKYINVITERCDRDINMYTLKCMWWISEQFSATFYFINYK